MPESITEHSDSQTMMQFATQIVTAFVSNNTVAANMLPDLIQSTFQTLHTLENGTRTVTVTTQPPAVSIKKSITDDYIICLEDGKKLKMLKRYIRTQYNLSPEEYKRKWGLPADYPLVAPNYAKRRSDFAKKNGLGKSVTTRAKKSSRKRTTRTK